MPELAEVEYYRQLWQGALGQRITAVELHVAARVFRGCDTAGLAESLRGRILKSSRSHGKQLLMGFSGGYWLGLHLGMTGQLRVEPAEYLPAKHDHLVLRQRARTLVLADHRMFGRVRFDVSAAEPAWWSTLPPRLPRHDFLCSTSPVFCSNAPAHRSKPRCSIRGVFLAWETGWRTRFCGRRGSIRCSRAEN